jgi:hypothetical protein
MLMPRWKIACRAVITRSGGTMKHSVKPFPPGSPNSAASALLENACSNSRRIARIAMFSVHFW